MYGGDPLRFFAFVFANMVVLMVARIMCTAIVTSFGMGKSESLDWIPGFG